MGYSIEILNNIRANASGEYQARIPEATRDNIAAIGNALQSYTLLTNEFCEALVNKIGKTILESKLFKNKLAQFKQGMILNQQDVEEIFVDMARSVDLPSEDGNSVNAFDMTRLDPAIAPSMALGAMYYHTGIHAIYHRQNRRDMYAITIGDVDFVRVFRSEATLDSFIAGLINSVYSGAAYDEWVAMKELLGTYDGYFDYQVPAFTDSTAEKSAKAFVKTVRKAVQDMSFASTQYNKAGVKTWTDPQNLVLLVNKDILAEVDVEVLAKAFNMGKTDFETKVVSMDDFGSMTDTYGLLVDKDFFRVWDTLSRMEPQRNAAGLFTNYFYHVHQILSLSTFKNAVRLTTKATA